MPVDHQLSSGPRACPSGLSRAFAFLGKRWNGVILGTLAQGPAGFAELTRAIPAISESVLSDRLGELARVGLVSRTVKEGPPLGVSYQLTDRGVGLLPALQELARWADEHLEGC
ncbi:helix-turn-helix domain-containing protein [Micromonospora sp. KC606]|uniref:winged helix-turn-helix transcriptional regulator n=1 Tax=Micromonospora sp. KC606 TaxID=2530379 RepID=UPI001A9DA03A|nr:helix-turn-helix domain-containing protein [Micromonospora sp. KC606]